MNINKLFLVITFYLDLSSDIGGIEDAPSIFATIYRVRNLHA
jgi:hypothetical protein